MKNTIRLSGFLQRHLIQPILSFLSQGVTPQKLSLTIALGVIIGMLPIFGIASLICAFLAFSLRLNMAAIQLTHYAATPLQVLLLVPFIRIGGLFFNQPPLNFSFSQLYEMFTNDVLATFQNLWFTFLLGFMGWLMVSIPVAFLLYFLTLPVFKKLSAGQLTPPAEA
ncbi:MAG: DUF2062 domain-containing protein [Bacteroidota bacterium]